MPVSGQPMALLVAIPASLSRKQQLLSLLPACSSLAHLLQVHAQLQTSGLYRDAFLASELLRFLALSPAGSLSHARRLLVLPSRSPAAASRASWNHLIRGCAQDGRRPSEALEIFLVMRRSGLRPNELTLPFVLKSCACLEQLRLGMQTHADAVKSGVDSVVYVQNTLMLVYGSCGFMDEAKKVFDGMPVRTLVSWNTFLTACADNSRQEECVELFFQMLGCGFEPDQTTFVVLLSVSAELGSLSFGKWIHGQIVGRKMGITLQLGTALVNMYTKCGAIQSARHVFDTMPQRNVWTWSTMILGLAQHSSAAEALQLFLQMNESSIQPNYVTFLGVLCACSHAGLVNDGYQYFHQMEHVHGIRPMMTHYSAMVDVLGRNGRLREAYVFINSIPVEPDAIVWRTLLSACQLHGSKDNSGVMEDVQRRLLSLEPSRSGNYVMAANIYSDSAMWEEAARVRRVMKEEGLKKVAGESWVEHGGKIHRFISGDDSCIGLEAVKWMLEGLNLHMRKMESIDKVFLVDTSL